MRLHVRTWHILVLVHFLVQLSNVRKAKSQVLWRCLFALLKLFAGSISFLYCFCTSIWCRPGLTSCKRGWVDRPGPSGTDEYDECESVNDCYPFVAYHLGSSSSTEQPFLASCASRRRRPTSKKNHGKLLRVRWVAGDFEQWLYGFVAKLLARHTTRMSKSESYTCSPLKGPRREFFTGVVTCLSFDVLVAVKIMTNWYWFPIENMVRTVYHFESLRNSSLYTVWSRGNTQYNNWYLDNVCSFSWGCISFPDMVWWWVMFGANGVFLGQIGLRKTAQSSGWIASKTWATSCKASYQQVVWEGTRIVRVNNESWAYSGTLVQLTYWSQQHCT